MSKLKAKKDNPIIETNIPFVYKNRINVDVVQQKSFHRPAILRYENYNIITPIITFMLILNKNS